MENATKALIIGGAVLIFVIIISIGALLYVRFRAQNATYKKIVQDVELSKYNSKFEIYVGRHDIIPEEVVTAVYLAQEYRGVSVQVKNGGAVISTSNPEDIMKQFGTNTFSCNTYTYDSTGRITSLVFTKN